MSYHVVIEWRHNGCRFNTTFIKFNFNDICVIFGEGVESSKHSFIPHVNQKSVKILYFPEEDHYFIKQRFSVKDEFEKSNHDADHRGVAILTNSETVVRTVLKASRNRDMKFYYVSAPEYSATEMDIEDIKNLLR